MKAVLYARYGPPGRVRPEQAVLINGGGGSGMYAIQLAKLSGAEVTGVDNAEKLGFMRSLGAAAANTPPPRLVLAAMSRRLMPGGPG